MNHGTQKRLTRLHILILAGSLLPISFGQAGTMLKYGQPIGGTLDATQQTEYTFEGATGDKPVITMNARGGEMFPYILLTDPQGDLIGEDSNSGQKGNALLTGIVLTDDGVYTVGIRNQATTGSGQYGLEISEESQRFYFDGIPDTNPSIKQAYQLSQAWDHTNITYYISNTLSQYDPQEVRGILAQAFQAWTSGTSLTFTEVQGQADIRVEFAPIDGTFNILGETCPPYEMCDSGSVTFDDSENWSLMGSQGYGDISLLGVASHEFGHAIGLLHTDDPNALMYPEYSAYILQPTQDDLDGLQRLYGMISGPLYNPPSLPGDNPQSGQMVVSGQLDDQHYTHFWDFDVQAGDTVTITMMNNSGDLDSFLVLLDVDNNIMSYDDDSLGDKNAQLNDLVFNQSGTYTVAASRYAQAQGYTTGIYTLTIEYDVK